MRYRIREVDDKRVGLSFGEIEAVLTFTEAFDLCLDLLKFVLDRTIRTKPPTHPPLQTFEFETVTPHEDSLDRFRESAADAELSALVGDGRAIG